MLQLGHKLKSVNEVKKEEKIKEDGTSQNHTIKLKTQKMTNKKRTGF
jgi:hypothetical protein